MGKNNYFSQAAKVTTKVKDRGVAQDRLHDHAPFREHLPQRRGNQKLQVKATVEAVPEVGVEATAAARMKRRNQSHSRGARLNLPLGLEPLLPPPESPKIPVNAVVEAEAALPVEVAARTKRRNQSLHRDHLRDPRPVRGNHLSLPKHLGKATAVAGVVQEAEAPVAAVTTECCTL